MALFTPQPPTWKGRIPRDVSLIQHSTVYGWTIGYKYVSYRVTSEQVEEYRNGYGDKEEKTQDALPPIPTLKKVDPRALYSHGWVEAEALNRLVNNLVDTTHALLAKIEILEKKVTELDQQLQQNDMAIQDVSMHTVQRY